MHCLFALLHTGQCQCAGCGSASVWHCLARPCLWQRFASVALLLSQELLRFLTLRTTYAGIALQTVTDQAFSAGHLDVPRAFLDNAVLLLTSDETMSELSGVDTDSAVQGHDVSFANVSMAWPRVRPLQ